MRAKSQPARRVRHLILHARVRQLVHTNALGEGRQQRLEGGARVGQFPLPLEHVGEGGAVDEEAQQIVLRGGAAVDERELRRRLRRHLHQGNL